MEVRVRQVQRQVPLGAAQRRHRGNCRTFRLTERPMVLTCWIHARQRQERCQACMESKAADRDDLYKIGVNSVVSFPDRVSCSTATRRCLTVRQRSTASTSVVSSSSSKRRFRVSHKRNSLNSTMNSHAAQFRNIVEPYLRDVKSRRGSHRLPCRVRRVKQHGTAVVEQNRFVGDIFVKPARSINFIQLNFVAVRA
jgi:hypothetical protein